MKKILLFSLTVTVISCTTGKEVQMSMSDVQLVKIDTIQRYPNTTEKILTWQDGNHMSYVTFVPIETYYVVGARMKVLTPR